MIDRKEDETVYKRILDGLEKGHRHSPFYKAVLPNEQCMHIDLRGAGVVTATF